MTLCALLQLDFTDGCGRLDEAGAERYAGRDLWYGVMWADCYMADGYTHEPMKGYDLAAFRAWCLAKLVELAAYREPHSPADYVAYARDRAARARTAKRIERKRGTVTRITDARR